MSVLDTIFSVLKGAHPDASDEDIKSYIDSAKASPEQMASAASPFAGDDPSNPEAVAAVKQAAPAAPQPMLSMPQAPDMSLKFPDVNSVPSSFDVNVSNSTATQNGKPESLPSGHAVEPTVSPMLPDEPPTPAPEAVPTKEIGSSSSKGRKAAPKDDTAALKEVLAPQGKSEGEDALDAKNKRLKELGAVGGFIGGVGDAIGNAAVPFGGRGSTGTQERINENTNAEVTKNKAAFEVQEQKDPNSAISKHYQKVLNLMLGDKASGFNIPSMSAAHIAQTLPEVEKYMQKELGLKQIQANKDVMMSEHEQGRQDKLEKEGREWYDSLTKARNGELGVQNAKVDQARHLLQLYKQAEESGKPINNSQYGELAIGAANLVAGGAQNVSDHTRQMIMQSTAKGNLNQALTYAGFDPSTLGGSTDAVLHSLKDTILRQGAEAERQRDKFIQDHKQSMPSGLDPKQFDRLTSVDLGNSLKEFQPKAAAGPAVRATAPNGTVKKIGNHSFTVMNGQWHEILH